MFWWILSRWLKWNIEIHRQTRFLCSEGEITHKHKHSLSMLTQSRNVFCGPPIAALSARDSPAWQHNLTLASLTLFPNLSTWTQSLWYSFLILCLLVNQRKSSPSLAQPPVLFLRPPSHYHHNTWQHTNYICKSKNPEWRKISAGITVKWKSFLKSVGS